MDFHFSSHGMQLNPLPKPNVKEGAKSCYNCKNFGVEHDSEGWEHPTYSWDVCYEKAGMQNLTSFPFLKTKCKLYDPS